MAPLLQAPCSRLSHMHCGNHWLWLEFAAAAPPFTRQLWEVPGSVFSVPLHTAAVPEPTLCYAPFPRLCHPGPYRPSSLPMCSLLLTSPLVLQGAAPEQPKEEKIISISMLVPRNTVRDVAAYRRTWQAHIHTHQTSGITPQHLPACPIWHRLQRETFRPPIYLLNTS